MATQVNLRKDGKRDSNTIVKELCAFSPRRGTRIKKAQKCFERQKQEGLAADKAVALIVNANLSTHQYNTIRQQANAIHSKMFPLYYNQNRYEIC